MVGKYHDILLGENFIPCFQNNLFATSIHIPNTVIQTWSVAGDSFLSPFTVYGHALRNQALLITSCVCQLFNI